jgi:hypothetical protein
MRDVIITGQNFGEAIVYLAIVGACTCAAIVVGFVMLMAAGLHAMVSPLFRAERENDSEPDAMAAINDDLPSAIHQAQRPERDFISQPVMFPAPLTRGGEIG